jgi:hypothetical protein
MFKVGEQYTRKDIYMILNIPTHRQGGDWQNGYHREEFDYYIFCNVGVAGRTGHDYDNHFEGNKLVWHGKTKSHFQQPTIRNLLSKKYRKLIFFRYNDYDPFTYAGVGSPIPHYEIEKPARIDWEFNEVQGDNEDNLPSPKKKRSTPDPETKTKIELSAIEFVWRYFESESYLIDDKQKENCGYDLLASKESHEVRLEVKGTASKDKRFFISRNERLNSVHPDWRLALVTDVFGSPQLFLYTKEEMEAAFQMDALSWECNESKI